MKLPVYPRTLWALLERRAEETPDHILLLDDRDQQLTARDWFVQSEAVAAGLYQRGVRADTVVSWQLPTSLEACVLTLALARLGAIQNPLVPILRRNEVGFIAEQAGTRLLITPGTWRGFDYRAMAADIGASLGIETLAADDHMPRGDPAMLPAPPTGEGDPVRYLYYTSGTTAAPKGAQHTDRSAMAAATGSLIGTDVGPADRLPLAAPYTHIGGIALTVVCLYSGCSLVLFDRFDPSETPVVMAEKGVTMLGSAPPFLRAYLEAQQRDPDHVLFPRLRAFRAGGSPRSEEVCEGLRKVFGLPILSAWGMTEFPNATYSSLWDDEEDLATTEGQLVPGVELRVVGSDGQQLPPGQEGELWLRGPQGCAGYVDRSLDADAFDANGFLRTGDLGALTQRGRVRITGRLKDVIIRNAENISAQEVEGVVRTIAKVADVAVIGVPDPKTGERVCAVVELAPGTESLDLAEVAAVCRSAGLANQKIPERIEIVDALPRSGLGKVMKGGLKARFSPMA